jgi:hypothetical protein
MLLQSIILWTVDCVGITVANTDEIYLQEDPIQLPLFPLFPWLTEIDAHIDFLLSEEREKISHINWCIYCDTFKSASSLAIIWYSKN